MTPFHARRLAWLLALAVALSPLVIAPAGTAPADMTRAGGGVAFTFSSGWASGTQAAQILESHGMRGTFYVSNDLLRVGPW